MTKEDEKECDCKYLYKVGRLCEEEGWGVEIGMQSENDEIISLDTFGIFKSEHDANIAANGFVNGLLYWERMAKREAH